MTPALFMFTIFIIMVMSAVSLIAVVLAIKNKNDINRNLRNLSVFLLMHMVFAFLQYYFSNYFVGEIMLKLLSVTADVFYFCFVASWINIIAAFAAFSSHRQVVIAKPINIAIAVFCVAAESIVLFCGRYNEADESLYFTYEVMRDCITILNIVFAVGIFAIGVISLGFAISGREKGLHRNGEIFFGVMIIPYMVWILVFDYISVNGMKRSILDVMVIDPIFLICCMLDIAILVFFFRKYPFEITEGSHLIDRDEAIEKFAAQYSLTKREREVMGCVCKGMNNPEIAEDLCISGNTVKRHLNNIFQKTGVHNRYDLISKVLE